MASKGRKAQAAAARGEAKAAPVQIVRPPRAEVEVDNPAGGYARDLSALRIAARPLTAEEWAEWERVAHPALYPAGSAGLARNLLASEVLLRLQKEIPALVTFVPADPGEPWADCAEWLATTKPANYEANPPVEMDPEFTSEGGTPLLALLALIERRFKQQRWWPAGRLGGNGTPLIIHYSTVAAYAPDLL